MANMPTPLDAPVVLKRSSRQGSLLLLSLLFQTTFFTGVKIISVFQMTGGGMSLGREEALNVYGLFLVASIFMIILGGILGDLLIGNNKAFKIGVGLQCIAALCLLVPFPVFFYLGLGFTAIGAGLYLPNLYVVHAKGFFNRTNNIDAAFGFQYAVRTIGATIGALMIFLIIERSIFLGLLALVIPISIATWLLQYVGTDKAEKAPVHGKNGRKWSSPLIAVLLTMVYWAVYETFSDFISPLYLIEESRIPENYILSWVRFTTLAPCLIFLIISYLWLSYRSSSWFKIGIGFLFSSAAIGICFAHQSELIKSDLIAYALSFSFMSIAEFYIMPSIYSLVIQNSNPKYLATILGLVAALYRVFSLAVIITLITGYTPSSLEINSTILFIIGAVVLIATNLLRKPTHVDPAL